MNNTWFTSDTHFGHKNILKFAKESRKNHTDINEMNEELIHIWNEQVNPLDTVYHLGDFSFMPPGPTEKILSQLNGNIHLIKGNHDYWINNATKKYLKSINVYKTFKDKDKRAVLFHYPIYEWDRMHHGSFHLYGHTHGSVQLEGKALDVGIDNRPNNDMKLWEWEEIVEYMADKPIRNHH